MIETMLYRRYKTSYADCKTVPDTYDKANKTIQVIIPDGRMKPSGTRGQRYLYINFDGISKSGKSVYAVIKAVSTRNAIKRLLNDNPECMWDISGWPDLEKEFNKKYENILCKY